MDYPYPPELLDYWECVANPMGPPCNHCDDLQCEHRFNGEWWPDEEE